jgi:uncharacterized Zn-binding protein involved in type VI secretion
MLRKLIVVGDAPATGGHVLPYEGQQYTVQNHQVALIGGSVYCEGCNSVGLIAKAGGPRRMQFISEIALEGDVIQCHCPTPPPLVSTLQSISTFEDGEGWGAAYIPGTSTLPFAMNTAEVAASKKLVDKNATYPVEAEQTENICPNMTNRDFCNLALSLRDQAVRLIDRRLMDLSRWEKADRSRVERWFGNSEEKTRQHLRSGLSKCSGVLRGLTCVNFIRYSETWARNVGCVLDGQTNVAAAVCGPDTRTRTIAININFCELRQLSPEKDSQLSTLIHEVTHFDDTFASKDSAYTFHKSLELADSDPRRAFDNADSITGYVVWGVIHGA